jgi:hypothetical protein
MSQKHWTEEELVTKLSSVLLKDEIDGLDEDLVAYLSGLVFELLLEAKDEESTRDILDESMVPFLDSVECPPELVEAAKEAILSKAHIAVVLSSAAEGGAKKLKQGIVNMSSTLTDHSEDMWGTGEMVKANANAQKDMYNDNTSAKDRRKQRQELERTRRELAGQHEHHEQPSSKAGVSVMLLPTVKSKERDVNLQRISLALDNGTLLLEQGDLKFVYQRRYGLVS